MSSSASDDPLYADLASPDDDRAREAVRACTERLRSFDGHDLDPIELGERLLPLCAHKSAKVRQALAESCEVLPDSIFERAVAALMVDSDHYVRQAAERASGKRATRKKSRAKEDEQEREVARLLDAIEGKHGKAARRLADRAVQREKEYFVRKLYHELSKIVTPLQFSIHRIGAEAAREKMDRDVVAKNAAIAKERLAFLWAIVESARAITATVTAEFREENVFGVVDEARAQLLERLGSRAARVQFANKVDPALVIPVHRHSLLQALQNALQNGAEAYEGANETDGGQPIRLEVTAKLARAGAQVVIECRDFGVGMTEEQQQHLFVPFGSWKPGGTGLGLLIVRKMIEDVHGGALAIESAKGKGTAVKMTVPAKRVGAR